MFRTPSRRSRRAVAALVVRSSFTVLFAIAVTSPATAFAALRACPQAAQLPESSIPQWLGPRGLDARGVDALDALLDAPRHGLDPSVYGATDIANRAFRLARGAAQPRPGSRHAFNRELTAALLCYLGHLRHGAVDASALHPMLPAKNPADLHRHLLAAWRDATVNRLPDELAPASGPYRALVRALATHRALAENERHREAAADVGDGRPLQAGLSDLRVPALRARLRFLGDMAQDGQTEPQPASTVFDAELHAAVVRFQRRHGLEPDGVVGAATRRALNTPLRTRVRQIEWAMERLRWLPRDATGAQVFVNLPEFRLLAMAEGSAVEPLRSRVVIGRSEVSETPLYVGTVAHVEFNPYWNVPYRIARDELLPALRRDPRYLSRKNMEVVRGDGSVVGHVDDALLDELRAGAARIRQRPGAANALGGVKFVLPNDRAIYLHDTSQPHLFDRARRDLSHGCVRVEHPAALASLILADDAHWSAERIDDILKSEQTRVVRPRRPATVIFTYLTAVSDDAFGVRFLPDVYGHDARPAPWLTTVADTDEPAARDARRILARQWLERLRAAAAAA